MTYHSLVNIFLFIHNFLLSILAFTKNSYLFLAGTHLSDKIEIHVLIIKLVDYDPKNNNKVSLC